MTLKGGADTRAKVNKEIKVAKKPVGRVLNCGFHERKV